MSDLKGLKGGTIDGRKKDLPWFLVDSGGFHGHFRESQSITEVSHGSSKGSQRRFRGRGLMIIDSRFSTGIQ